MSPSDEDPRESCELKRLSNEVFFIFSRHLYHASLRQTQGTNSWQFPLENKLLKFWTYIEQQTAETVCVIESNVEYIPNAHSEIIGKLTKMKFIDEKE